MYCTVYLRLAIVNTTVLLTTANKEQRIDVLKNARFRKTWYISSGKNVGKATLKAPFPKNPELRLWTGKIPKT